ncbi:hypothetical protein XELAEV_18046052mg [Xenopus laevis]|uniref:Homologous recombination OB-fold protein OB-fold domain-containing protein n=1 Tax=Xenopus laevis TaxID=8355 RepID=A0A974H091_XENLA|nr:hypothetical protein XELAEV_18046052mg [Xenopus laevis]
MFPREDFLLALDNTEESVFHAAPSGTRSLRPICTDEPKSQAPPPWHTMWNQEEMGKQDPMGMPYDLAQDMDDEELLSVCSMIEVPQRPSEAQKAGQSVSVPMQDGTSRKNSSSVRLRPTGEACVGFQAPNPRASFKVTAVCQPGSVCADSPSPLQIHSIETEHFQSPRPTAKRPCRRDMIDPQSVEAQNHRSPSVQLLPHQVRTPSTVQGAGALCTELAPFPAPTQLLSHTPMLTNHLVQLVTAANQTPRRRLWETPPPKERRFPGPAGLLPQQGNARGLDEILVSTPHTPAHGARAKLGTKASMASQQQTEEEFGRGPWAALKAELALDENDPCCFLRTYSVVMVLRKGTAFFAGNRLVPDPLQDSILRSNFNALWAALKQLPKNKVPQMAVALKSLTPANGDASAVFRDHTGDIQGTVHHLLLEEKESDLKVGSVLLLQQVGVFSPSHRNHYLNVTPNNLVKIYPPEEEGPHTSIEAPPGSSEQTDLNSNHVGTPACPSVSIRTAGDPQPLSLEEWDMDDLDSLLCDLPEDTGTESTLT